MGGPGPLAGPEENRLTQQKVDRLRDIIAIITSAHQIADCCQVSGCLLSVRGWRANFSMGS